MVLRHQEEEGLGTIAEWVLTRGHTFFYTNFFAGQKPPISSLMGYDALISMGGPMSVNDSLPMVKQSLAATADFIEAGRPVLGICLGSQAIAKSAGGEVTPCAHEVGFSQVEPVLDHPYFAKGVLDTQPWDVFQMHGETFSLPEGAKPLFRGSVVPNQGFTFKNALALQFHNEVSKDWYSMLYTCMHTMPLKTEDLEPVNDKMPFAIMQKNLFALLDVWQESWVL